MCLHVFFSIWAYRFGVPNEKKMFWQQAQRRAATETAAFIWVFRYNDETSFHLENDFEMNSDSTQTWETHGTHMDNMSNP